MISIVQAPSVSELIGAHLRTATPANPIETPWLGGGGRAIWTARGAYAIAALAKARSADLRRVPCIWFPDYFCNQSLAPLRALGITPIFYPISAARAPNWQACRELAERYPPDVFAIVHYFGVRAEIMEARAFANEHRAWLLEDAAHVLRPEPSIGSYGDFVLYCPHKWLAVPDGAMLIHSPAGVPSMPIEEALHSLGQRRASSTAWLVKRLIQSSPLWRFVAPFRSNPSGGFYDDPVGGRLDATPGLSHLASRLLRTVDLDRIAERRIRNHRALAGLVRENTSIAIISENAAVPYRLVLQFRNPDDAANIFNRLQRKRLPVETWPDMAPEVKKDQNRHGVALALRRSTILLPVHQNLMETSSVRAYRRELTF